MLLAVTEMPITPTPLLQQRPRISNPRFDALGLSCGISCSSSAARGMLHLAHSCPGGMHLGLQLYIPGQQCLGTDQCLLGICGIDRVRILNQIGMRKGLWLEFSEKA